MKTGTKLIALLSVLALMVSLFALPVFAEEAAQETDGNGLSVAAIVWICVGAAIVIAGIILGIKFRAKIAKALRVYKSEFKKVSWLSWEQTRKSTLVVLVVLIVCTAVICLLDFALSKGFQELILNAFAKIGQ